MKILNLVSLEKSDIKYRIDEFPDGQQQVVILDKNPNKTGYKTENYISGTNKKYLILEQIVPVKIKSRLNNFKDLELIICATKSLRNLGVKEIHLYTPYFLGSRSDRQFEEGSNNYLKDVICPIINSLNFESVTVLDPHSDVLEACLNNFKKESNLELVKFTIRELCGFTHGKNPKVDDFILVSPDAGASKKIYKLAEQIGYKGEVITCNKDRDVDGKLTKTVVPDLPINKDVIIIDDICDGGATFINIAKKIKEQYESVDKHCQGKVYLIVTHGIFSKGFSELSKYFDGIYCTNSYVDLSKYSERGWDKDNVKQLNVF
jgi:ribose-phosphate pyrophosphokinase